MRDFIHGPLVGTREVLGLLADHQCENNPDDRSDHKINRAVEPPLHRDAVFDPRQQKRRRSQPDRRQQARQPEAAIDRCQWVEIDIFFAPQAADPDNRCEDADPVNHQWQ